jgi:hypothetical protein
VFADDRPALRDTRELEAEAVAFVVGEAVGLHTREASRNYLAPSLVGAAFMNVPAITAR